MSLAQRAALLVYGRAAAFGLSLVIPVALVRLLAQDEYGSYQQLVLLYATAQAFLLLGVPRSLSYFFPRLGPGGHAQLLRQSVALLAMTGLLAIVLGLGAQLLLTDHPLQPYLGLLGLYTALMLLVAPLQNLLVVEGRERASALSMVGFVIVDVVVMPAAVWLRPDVWGILWGITVAATIKAAVSLGYAWHRYLAHSGGRPFVREQLAYGVPVGMMAMVGILNLNIDKYLVGLFFPVGAFAVYYIGALWAPVFNWTTQSVVQVVIPRLSAAHYRGDLAAMQQLRSRMASRMALVYFPLATLMAIIARPLIELMFTSAYAGAVPIFTIYLLLLFNRPFGSGEVLMAAGRTRFLFRLALAVGLLNLGLSLLLLARSGLGLLALPVATVTVSWISAFAILHRSNRELGVTAGAAYGWRTLAAILASSALAGAVAWQAAAPFAGATVIAVAIAAYSVAFALAGRLTGALGPAEWRLLRSLRPF
jgi:O-antigen/teichoic acid export membrane protein